jgi:hypothetical protein
VRASASADTFMIRGASASASEIIGRLQKPFGGGELLEVLCGVTARHPQVAGGPSEFARPSRAREHVSRTARQLIGECKGRVQERGRGPSFKGSSPDYSL